MSLIQQLDQLIKECKATLTTVSEPYDIYAEVKADSYFLHHGVAMYPRYSSQLNVTLLDNDERLEFTIKL